MGNEKKSAQLGMPYGTASHRLRKMILFSLLELSGRAQCHRCGNKIESVDDLSIDHIVPWLDSDDPVNKFFDVSNISFSHLSCNCSHGRRQRPNNDIHGSKHWRRGCRCALCLNAKNAEKKRYRDRKGASGEKYN